MFDTVAGRLDEGQSKQFTLSLPLRSDTDVSLDITEPGVYPLMVNVNGTPEYGGAARLDDARFLLPVFGVPGTPAVPPDISSPVAVTMLWPLADRPRLAAGVPGSVTEPVRLVDDDLATSLADGGRLDELLGAAEFATRESVDRDHTLRDSLCLAVDPDLLITVENMTRGYLVVDDPSDPTGSAHEGTGKDAASAWLDRARSLAASMCTTSVPFAQADLSAITEVANPDLTATAVEAPADIVDNALGVTSLRNFVWSDAGVLDDATAQMLRGDEATTTLVAANSVDTTTPRDSAHVIEATPPPAPFPRTGRRPRRPPRRPRPPEASTRCCSIPRSARRSRPWGRHRRPPRTPRSAPGTTSRTIPRPPDCRTHSVRCRGLPSNRRPHAPQAPPAR